MLILANVSNSFLYLPPLLICLLFRFLLYFFYPGSLWRGALSLLSSGHFKEAEQTQTAAQTRQQGKYT